MEVTRSCVHHVVGMVRPENFTDVVGKISVALQTAFYGPFDREEYGIRLAISMDAGIELIAPISADPDNPMIQSLDQLGERWISVVVGVRDLDDACARLEKLGYEMQAKHELHDVAPIADRFEKLDEIRFEEAAFGGLPIVLADIVER